MWYSIQYIGDHGAAIKIKGLLHNQLEAYHYNAVDDISDYEASVDIVPAVKLPDWPQFCSEWITRQRRWPPQSMVEQIVSQGVMEVCKAGVGGDCFLTNFPILHSNLKLKSLSLLKIQLKPLKFAINIKFDLALLSTFLASSLFLLC